MKHIPMKAVLKELRRRNIRFSDPDREKEFAEESTRTALKTVARQFDFFDNDHEGIRKLDKFSHGREGLDYDMPGILRKFLKDILRHNKTTLNMLNKQIEKLSK